MNLINSSRRRNRILSTAAATVLVALLALVSAPGLVAQTTATGAVAGRVTFAVNGEYLDRARVTLENAALETFTDSLGNFAFSAVPAGQYRLRVFYTGLTAETATVTVIGGQSVQRDFVLTERNDQTGSAADPVKLGQFVVASSRRRDCDQRATLCLRYAQGDRG